MPMDDQDLKVKVPVYYIADPQTKGGKAKLRVFIMTEAGFKLPLYRVAKDLEAYENYARTMEEGGYVRHLSYLGGTYNQRYPTGLYLSHDWQQMAFSPDGYTWDEMAIVQRALDAGDVTTAQSILTFYLNTYNALTKGSQFPGFATSYNVITGEPMGLFDINIASNASVGYMVMKYEHYMAAQGKTDDQFAVLKEGVFNWLSRMHKGDKGALRIMPPHPGDSSTDIAKYAEPNAIVWAFMNEYAKEHGGKGHEITDSILKWLTSKEMWDGRFIKNGQGKGKAGIP